MSKVYKLGIIGGGVMGTSTAFNASWFSNIDSIALFESHGNVAQVNSNVTNNSHTLHSGENETNIPLPRALEVKDAAHILSVFLERFTPHDAFLRLHKMVIGVGAHETSVLRRRFAEFKPHFPDLKFLEKEEVAEYEPNVMKGRDPIEEITALFVENGRAVNYQKLAEEFLKRAQETEKSIDTFFNTKVETLRKENNLWVIETNGDVFKTEVLVVAAGSYSLLFAQTLGYAQEFAVLPVAGSFYRAGPLVNGKVYTVQKPKTPFAEIHADPSVENHRETRFGPTAVVLPFLERHRWSSVIDFGKSGILSSAAVATFLHIFSDPDLRTFAEENLAYELPVIGKRRFTEHARKIIPLLELHDLTFAKGAGGIRPQLINLKKREIEHGTNEFAGEKSIFIVTPSPGASESGKKGAQVTRKVTQMLGPRYVFDETKYQKMFYL